MHPVEGWVVQMVQSSKCIDALDTYRLEKQYAKARRLANNAPKWKDEKYMTPEELDAYIDRYLTVPDGEEPSESQTKIAQKQYDLKNKYAKEAKTLAEVEDNTITLILQKASEPDTE